MTDNVDHERLAAADVQMVEVMFEEVSANVRQLIAPLRITLTITRDSNEATSKTK